ncbi:hypothetical protein [Erwinia mallotivora]|nr:hypothetical protein [Erwinia mallotivora]
MTLVEIDIPEPKEGQVLIRVIFSMLDMFKKHVPFSIENNANNVRQ